MASPFDAETDDPIKIDPIKILILVAANGYGEDIAHVSYICQDPDLQSYLTRVPRGPQLRTPLHYAAYINDVERAAWLCDRAGARRASLDAMDILGTTPLCLCAHYQRVEMSTLLLARGADISPALLRVLRDPTGNEDGLIALRFLIGRGSSPHATINGNPILYLACNFFNVPAIRLLLELGADPNCLAADGDSSLLALSRGDYTKDHSNLREAAKLIIDHGAVVNFRSSCGVTASTNSWNYGLVGLWQYLRTRGGTG